MEKSECPIGVFDSGVGGISVLRQIVKLLPEEDYIYFGDSANAPYGTKTLEEVQSLTLKNIDMLTRQGAKAVVVACNTATSAAIELLREKYPQMPVIGIEPAVKPAVFASAEPVVLVMATPMTLHEEKFKELMEKYTSRAEIIPLACPRLVEFVESGDIKSQELRNYLLEIFKPYQKRKITAIVLGCTHFPFARDLIQEIWGSEVAIFDGAPGTARELQRQLREKGLLNKRGAQGTVTMKNSLGPDEESLGRRLLEL